MFQLALDFEYMARYFKSAVLIVPGLVCVAIGLFTWLGGLGFRKTLAAIVGMIGGAVAGFLAIGPNFLKVVIIAVSALLIARYLHRLFIIILTACLVAMLALVLLAVPHMGGLSTYAEYNPPNQDTALTNSETLELTRGYVFSLAESIKNIILQMSAYQSLLILAVLAGFVFFSIYFKKVSFAFCCATFGTALIFMGMILLLIYKGAVPMSRISQNPHFYLMVLIVMVAFGTVVQVLLCPSVIKKPTKEEPADITDKKPTKSLSWRTQ